jgi:hypothetical protein
MVRVLVVLLAFQGWHLTMQRFAEHWELEYLLAWRQWITGWLEKDPRPVTIPEAETALFLHSDGGECKHIPGSGSAVHFLDDRRPTARKDKCLDSPPLHRTAFRAIGTVIDTRR